MKTIDSLKYLSATDLFRIRDCIKILATYFSLKTLQDIEKEVEEELLKLQKGER